MMRHPAIRTLSRLIEGELGAWRRARVERHVAGCAQCRARLDLLEREVAMALKQTETAAGSPGAADDRKALLAQLPPQPAWTREAKPCGEIEAIQGVALVFRNGDAEGIEAFPGMALLRGDSLRVIGKSLAMVRLTDGSTLYLNRGSEATFFKGRYELDLGEGELFAMMTRQPRPFRLWTPAATLEVLGTDFDAKVSEDKSQTELSVLKGRVAFENKAGRAVVEKRRQVAAKPHVKPAPARITDWSRVGGWASPLRSRASEEQRGMALGRWLALIALVVIVGVAAWMWKSRHDIDTDASPTAGSTWSATEIETALEGTIAQLQKPPTVAERRQLRKFVSRYALAPDEDAKYIPAPWIDSRLTYFRLESPGQAEATPEGPDFNFLHWDDREGLISWSGTFGGVDKLHIAQILGSSAGISQYEIQAMDSVQLVPQGDFVVRKSLSRDEKAAALLAAIGRQIHYPYRGEWRNVTKRVIVARGTYRLNKMPDSGNYDIEIYADRRQELRYGGGGSGDGAHFITWLGQFLDQYIVNEATFPDGLRIQWHDNYRSEASQKPDLVLQNVARQSGLTFTWEERTIPMLFIVRDQSGTALSSRPANSGGLSMASKADVDHAMQEFQKFTNATSLKRSQVAQLREFMERYIPARGEAVRFVPEPYPEGRPLFYKLSMSFDPEQAVEIPTMLLRWTDDGRLLRKTDFGMAPGIPLNIKSVLSAAADVEFQRIKSQGGVPSVPMGDFVVRTSAEPNDIIQGIVDVAEENSGIPLAWEWRTEPQRVLVVGGELKLNVNPVANAVILYSGNEPRWRVRPDEIAANPGHFEENTLEFFLGSRLPPLAGGIVVNEVRPPRDQKFRWHYDIPPDFGESPGDRERLFENIAKQTGLTFTWAGRPVQMLYVWRAEDDREGADRILSKLAPSLTDIKRQPTPEELEQLREFVSLYALAPGENAKFIPPPGHIGRLVRYQLVVPQSIESSPYSPDENFYYFWENDSLSGSARFNRPITLDDILPAYARESADSYERVIPPDAQTIPAGDVVIRKSASREDWVRDLFDAIRGKVQYPFRHEWRTETREGRETKVLYVLPDDDSLRAASPEMIKSAMEPRAAINDATLENFIEYLRLESRLKSSERAAMREFLSQYGLAEGQLVKYIPQPGTPERAEFVQLAVKDPSYPPRPTDPGNVSILFAWVDGAGLNYMNRTSTRHRPGGFSIRELAQKMWRMDPMLVEGPPEALAARFAGDFTYRPGRESGDQRLIDATLQLLRDKAGYPWRATWINTPHEVIIATGTWRPNPESKTGSGHPMFLLYSDTFTDGGPGGGADIVAFMHTIGELTGRPVITKLTAEVPDSPPISHHVTAAPMNLTGDRAELRRFLDRLERQTGLTFSLETRPIRRLMLEKINQ